MGLQEGAAHTDTQTHTHTHTLDLKPLEVAQQDPTLGVECRINAPNCEGKVLLAPLSRVVEDKGVSEACQRHPNSMRPMQSL